MSRDKQIEEMANIIEDCAIVSDYDCNKVTCAECKAIRVYNAGYRKDSVVAEEIFEELKKVMIDEYRYPVIAELKKKYTNTEGGE